jgi:hypothetical protein
MFNRNLLYLSVILVLSLPFSVTAREYNEVFSGNNFNITSLMNAVYHNDFRSAGIFLKSGADVNEKNMAGVTALHVAAKANSVDAMKVLIEYKANLNATDDEQWTPLMRACLAGNYKAAELLVNSGANIWLKNKFGESALVHSVMSNTIECLVSIKSNYKKSKYDKNTVIAEINKSLNLVYKKEDKEMEKILDEFYEDVTKNEEGLGKKESVAKGKALKNEKDKKEQKEKEKREKEEKKKREDEEKEKKKREKEEKEKKQDSVKLKNTIIYIFQGKEKKYNKEELE